MNHVKDILAGLAIFLVVAGLIILVIGGGLKTAHDNNEKVKRLTHMCVEQGYSGWMDSGKNGGTSQCYSGVKN